MSKLDILGNVIYEMIESKKNPTNKSKSRPFGNELFGDFRNKKEPDTEEEKEIFNMLKNFIKNNEITDEFVDGLEKLKKFRDKYEGVVTPESTNLFRGMNLKNNIDFGYFTQISPIMDDYEVKFGKNKTKFYRVMVNYMPQKLVESWTAEYGIAENHANNDNGIILDASFSVDELLFNVDFMNRLSTSILTKQFKEYEILRVSAERVLCSAYISENIMHKFEVKSWDG